MASREIEAVSGQWSVVSNVDRTLRVRERHTECADYIRRRRLRRRAAARDRRGVLILVVLSLLILFVVIAVMFVVVASRARAVAKSYAEFGRTGDTPQEIIDSLAHDLIRGSLNPHSPFRSTSILEDLYGHQSVRGVVTQVYDGSVPARPRPANGAGGFFQIEANFAGSGDPTNIKGFSPVKDAYSGCVLTFISGAGRGVSARILEYWPADQANGTQAKFRAMILRDEFTTYANGVAKDQIQFIDTAARGAIFVVNGRPFSGTGVGYNARTQPRVDPGFGRLTVTDPSVNLTPYALLPNPAFFTPPPDASYNYTDPASPGGANEGYDAPDFQNPFLAYYGTPNPTSSAEIKPSFHDPALLSYFAQQPGNLLSNPNLLRKVMFRPSPMDHPLFAQVNPAFNAITGPWDIDNDGDGIPDSVWVDAGYPLQMTKQGQLYKPLVAVLILDMDGRLNLNVHGMPQETMQANQNAFANQTLAAGGPFPNPPRGAGFGPAEVRLGAVLKQTFSGAGATNFFRARYGSDGVPGAQSGVTNWSDAFNQVKLLEMCALPNNWPPQAGPNNQWPVSNFGSPADVKGRLACALDPLGQPAWDKSADVNNQTWSGELQDNPYEFDVSRYGARALPPPSNNSGPYDTPFSVGELERLLRPADIDTSLLPTRLAATLAADLNGAPYRRNELTVDSWDLPVPSMLAGGSMRGFLGNAAVPGRMTSLPELLHWRMSFELSRSMVPQNQWPSLTSAVDAMLSPDLRRGLRMDVNRPFGNGKDNGQRPGQPGDGVVDDPFEFNDTVNFDAQPINGPPNVPFDQANGQDVNGDKKSDGVDRFLARQLFARHLYVLMMLVSEDRFAFPLSQIPIPQGAGNAAPKWTNEPERLNQPRQQELKAQRLAQWAINVVDFRDPDNIMTPFEFDLNPFDGWNVDGVIDDGTGQVSKDDNHPDRRMAWGCEMPVAILTENVNWHDRRVKDTNHEEKEGGGDGEKREENGNPADEDLDQTVIPRGVSFIEIMAIFDPNVPVQSGDLFEFVPAKAGGRRGNWVLNLGKLTRDKQTPVWRLAITNFHTEKDNNVEKVSDIIAEHPDTVSLHPTVPWRNDLSNFSLLKNAPDNHNVEIERVIWMTNKEPAGPDMEHTFFSTNNSATGAQLEGFQYAVIGPGGTGAGARTGGKVKGIMAGWVTTGVQETQQIIFDPQVSDQKTAQQYPMVGTTVKRAIGIPVASKGGAVKSSDDNKPWAAGDRVGLSISEPLFSDSTHYYPKPSERNDDTDLDEAYGVDGNDNKKFIDKPLDEDDGMPLKERDMLKTGTYMNVRTVLLQRLANPLLPYNARLNPYITVDWMPMDLTVFNGEDKKPDDSMLDDWDPEDPTPETADVHFATRERGLKSTNGGQNSNYNIWTPISEEPEKTTRDPNAPDSYFPYRLRHTLGYLNKAYGNPTNPGGPAYLGAPAKPFPWIRWANRPFVNALELMEVPKSTPARLLLEFNYVDPQTTSPYDTSPDPNPYKRRFNHLLNFFHATDPSGNAGADFYRIFEFLHVPSPFVGTETMLDPRVFQTVDTSQGPPSPGAGGFGTESFHAPFNWVSNYRDPGKLNLNTMNSADVGNALRGASALPDFVSTRPRDPSIVISRRGGQMGTSAAEPVAGLPSIMPYPFRSPAGGDMVPDLSGNTQLKTAGVQVSLLRQGSTRGQAQGAAAEPLFADPALDANSRTDFANSDRNPAFRYAALERLANLTTTRSNVYAIWLTVGYFEVTPNPGGVDAGHPDGYQIGAELGTDTGEIERHRGFYIIDRTIPVGFERGYNHNVDRAILLKRFIE